ncbi:vacuolar sorting protein 28, putative [Babesia caballi]|uniref:Vacuolar sorting protein 28, putative n=1 Tax=Babesia caballi TaxID=5871 RepID=A0AAV4LSI2_BABCB|nr:vacuolar sorting protein 28, putative [Babesia caballi]
MEDYGGTSGTATFYDVDREANIYALLQALEHLEQAYVAGDSPKEEYEEVCAELLSLCRILEEATPNIFVDFSKAHKMNCTLALSRLKRGFPGAAAVSKPPSHKPNESYLLFELSEHFITLVDSLKLGGRLVDELFPLLHELITCLGYVRALDTNVARAVAVAPLLGKLHAWHERLSAMSAHESLSENDLRQLTMDTEAAHGSLKTLLRMQK